MQDSITNQTRRESLARTGKKSGQRRAIILEILGDKEMTAHEIIEELLAGGHIVYYDPNFARPRLTELLKDGKIEAIRKVPCPKTGRTVAVYRRLEIMNHMEELHYAKHYAN
jgi:predicted ArsR family transcriptional regulator